MTLFVLQLLLFLLLGSGYGANSTILDNIKVNQEVTVSGVSSGGAMAGQMLVAYSRDVKGAGIFAAPPYYCIRGVAPNVEDCMTTGLTILVDQLILAAEGFQALGLIDKLSNLVGSKVYIFSGKRDSVVWQRVVKRNEDFFKKLGSDIETKYDIDAEHTFPTDFFGNKCSKLGSPYINNWDFKGSRRALEHIMGHSLEPKIPYLEENLHSFDQGKYNPGVFSSFASSGLIYIPNEWKEAEWPLHIAFHGWAQTTGDIGLDYVYGTGFLGLAEANNIIVLFPQVKVSKYVPYNPKGWWDWWGYSEVSPTPAQWRFPTKDGIQTKAIYSMIKDLQSGSFSTHKEFKFKDALKSSY